MPDLPKEAVEALAKSLYEQARYEEPTPDWGRRWESLRAKQQEGLLGRARAYLDLAAPAIRKQVRERVEAELELDQLRSELKHIAENGQVPNATTDGLHIDGPVWAEGWLLSLSATPTLEGSDAC